MAAKHEHLHFISSLKIQKQLDLIFMLAVAAPILALGAFITYQSVRLFYERAYEQLESDNLRAKSILFDTTLSFYNISEDIVGNPQLKQILQENYATYEEAAKACSKYTDFEKTLKNNTAISSIEVYTANTTIGQSIYIKTPDSDKVLEWFSAVSVPNSICWESYESDEKKHSPELTLIHSFPFSSSEYPAILIIRMDNNYLKNRIQNNRLFTSLSIEKDPVFFSTTRALQGSYETAPIDYSKKYFQKKDNISYNGKKALSYISTLIPYKSQERIYITSLDFNIFSDIRSIAVLCISITLTAIFVPSVIIYNFSRQFSNRVKTLKNAMAYAASGNYDYIKTFQGDDEISSTFSDLQNLIDNVKEQESQMYLAQIKEQELQNRQQQMELMLLVSQINPHFIYNALETIRMMALDYGAEDVSEATVLLGSTMRYVLENTETMSVPLSKELDYIENYLAFQKIRFGDRINYTLFLEEGFCPEQYQILPLLLQPIVENSVIHGLEGIDENGRIEIHISRPDAKFLRITIKDNGVGIPKGQLEKLKINIENPGNFVSSGIGLHNINQRIKLFYGQKYGISISSNEGTLVTLMLPMCIPKK